jgi:hypothetical protein
VREHGGGASLPQEALASGGVAGMLREHELQGDVAPQDAVARPVDDTHAARAEPSEDVEVGDRARLHAGLPDVRAAGRCPESAGRVAGNDAWERCLC